MIHPSVTQGTYQPENPAEELAPNQKQEDILIIAKGGSIALTGSLIERAIGYAYSVVLIWGLGAESFGLFTLSMAINTLIGMVANLGLVQGVVRYGVIRSQAEGRTGVHQVSMAALKVSMPVSLATMVIVLWSADLIAGIFSKPEMSVVIRAMAVSIPFMTLQSVLLASTRSLKIIRYSAIVWVAQPLVALLLAGLFLHLGMGILAVSAAYSISYFMGACLAFYYYLRVMKNREKAKDKFRSSAMVKFSLPLSLVQWIYYANQRTEIFFLGLLPGAIDVGIYNIAWRLAGLETILVDSLNKIFGPLTSELSHQREVKKLGDLYKTMAKWAFTGGWILFLIYSLFATTIMTFFDESYARGTEVLIALAFAQLINAITGPCGTVLLMSGHSGVSLFNTLLLFGSSILLDWMLIPSYGLAGATLAGVLTIIFVNLLRVVEVWIMLKIHPFRWDFFKPFTAGILGFAAVILLRRTISSSTLLMDILWSMVLVLLYVMILFILKLDREDRMVLQTVLQKIVGSRHRK